MIVNRGFLILLISFSLCFSCQKHAFIEVYECEVVSLKRKLESDFHVVYKLQDIPKKRVRELKRSLPYPLHFTDDKNHKKYLRGYHGFIMYSENDVLSVLCLREEGGGIIENGWYFFDKQKKQVMKFDTFITLDTIEEIQDYIKSIDVPYYTDCYRNRS